MHATSNDQLIQFINDNPDEYPSFFLAEDSFAYKCYSSYSFIELGEKLKQTPDPAECTENGITEDQWKEGVLMAYTAFANEFDSMPKE